MVAQPRGRLRATSLALRPELQEAIPPFGTVIKPRSSSRRCWRSHRTRERTTRRNWTIAGSPASSRLDGALLSHWTLTANNHVLGPLDCVTVHPKPPDIVPHRLTEPGLWMPFVWFWRSWAFSTIRAMHAAAMSARTSMQPLQPMRPCPAPGRRGRFPLAEHIVNRWRYVAVALLVAASVLFFAWLYWSFIPGLAENERARHVLRGNKRVAVRASFGG